MKPTSYSIIVSFRLLLIVAIILLPSSIACGIGLSNIIFKGSKDGRSLYVTIYYLNNFSTFDPVSKQHHYGIWMPYNDSTIICTPKIAYNCVSNKIEDIDSVLQRSTVYTITIDELVEYNQELDTTLCRYERIDPCWLYINDNKEYEFRSVQDNIATKLNLKNKTQETYKSDCKK